jgi:hypothetical protein
MTSLETMTYEQFERHAPEILGRELGIDALARFLRLERSRTGDYTKERANWQKDLTVQEIVNSINRRRDG